MFIAVRVGEFREADQPGSKHTQQQKSGQLPSIVGTTLNCQISFSQINGVSPIGLGNSAVTMEQRQTGFRRHETTPVAGLHVGVGRARTI